MPKNLNNLIEEAEKEFDRTFTRELSKEQRGVIKAFLRAELPKVALACREMVPEEDKSKSLILLGYNDCRTDILKNLTTFIGDK